MRSPKQSLLSTIPSVDALLQDAELKEQTAGVAHKIVVACVRASIEATRSELVDGAFEGAGRDAIRREVLKRTLEQIRLAAGPHYRKVINATGVILHTALGRAVLPPAALEQIEAELSGYSLLQADVEAGRRSKRDGRIEWLLQQLTGAAAATVVNNNAAATWIVLNTVAEGREVIVSRGQLVEIGGAFRLPDVMAASGAKMVEVGTTNKTHPEDYRRAITENTAAILRVHPSNYQISGFTAEVALAELVEIAHAHGLPLIDDVGAGSLVDVSQFGFEPEPTLPDSVRMGADLITASADKLIGGSQGGIILGRADLVGAVRKNLFARIVRAGKLTLAALEATLSLFLDEAVAMSEIPTLRMLRRGVREIAEQAERIVRALDGAAPDAEVAAVDGFSQVGSGSLPSQNLPTRLVAIASRTVGASELARRLRSQRPAVFARIHADRVLIDPRTLLEGEETVVVDAVRSALAVK